MEEQRENKTKLHAIAICSCISLLGFIFGGFIAMSSLNPCEYVQIEALCEIECTNCVVDACTNPCVHGQCMNHTCLCDSGFWGDTCDDLLFVSNESNTSTILNISDVLNITQNLNVSYDNISHVETNIVTIPDQKTNVTNLTRMQLSIVRPSISQPLIKPKKIGGAIAISIISVFVFIGCIIGSGWYVKNRPNPLRTMVTRATSSVPINLTEEELKFIQMNPIIKAVEGNDDLFSRAFRNITKAIEKDQGHYYKEALESYDKGIDQLMAYMKTIINSQERFELAKRVDMYVQRARFIQAYLNNNDLDLPPTPRPPRLSRELIN